MKKIIITYIVCLFPLLSFSQSYSLGSDSAEIDSVADVIDVCEQICGLNFGASFETAEIILRGKFGRESAHAENEELIFHDKSYGGINFDQLVFGFQSDGRRTYFNKCVLILMAKNADDAKRKRDFLYKKLSNKYFLFTRTDNNKFKFYNGGTSPVNHDDWGFFIDVFHEGSVWAARLFYGPYQYVEEEF